MTYQRPMKYNTPTSYTMLNGWFLDNGDGSDILQYLTGGSIDTSGYSTISDPVYMADVNADITAYVAFVAGDKDKRIEDDDTLVGPLLAYKNNYPSANLGRFWVRDTRGTPATIADNSAIDMSTDSGTGTGTMFGASVSGDEIYANVYTIADFPGSPNPQVYIYQNHPQSGTSVRIAEWSAFSNWDRGTIDVLIPVKLGGTAINSGNIRLRVRQTGDTFTYVNAVIDTTNASRTPLSTETAADTVNITKGEHYLLYDAEEGGGFAAGNVIQNVSTTSGTIPLWYAEVVAVTDWGTEGVLTLRGLRGTITNNADIFVSTTKRGVANGTPGDTYGTWGSETASPIAGDFGKIIVGGTTSARRILRGFQDDGTTGKYVADANHAGTVTGDNRKPYYRDFNATEALSCVVDGGTMNVVSNLISTTLIAGYSDVTVAHINGTVAAGTFAGTFEMGERVTWDAGASSGIIVKTDGATSITLANVTSPDTITGDTITGASSTATCVASGNLVDANTATFAFSMQSAFAYSVFIQGGNLYEAGRDLDDIYAYLQFLVRDGASGTFYTSTGTAIVEVDRQEYIRSISTYAATKVAPFGSLAGGVFFGAQGVWIEGMLAGDANNIKLTDDIGTLHEPETSVTITVGNTRVDDVVTVYLEDGATGLPNKAQYTSHNTNNTLSASIFYRNATNFPNDTPTSGSFTVVDTSANQEHRYRYTSWSTTQLNLPSEVVGAADTSTATVELYDTVGTPFAAVQRGDIIRNTTDASWGYIVTVVSSTHVTTTQMRSATGTIIDWAVADGYEVNSLIATYNNTDKFFIPYIDAIEDVGDDTTPGSVTATLVYVEPRAVVVRVRNVAAATPIQPFETTSDITDSGMTVSAIRTEDEVYS